MTKLLRITGYLVATSLAGFLLACAGSTQPSVVALTKNSSPELNLSPPPTAQQPAPTDNVPRMEGPEAVRTMKESDAILVDTRDEGSFKTNHCKGAINIPYAEFSAGNFHDLPKDKKLIFYCT